MVELRDIVGQPEAVAMLTQALTGGRRHHAFLFAGPEGVGRRTTAVAFAKALLCGGSGPAASSLFAAATPAVDGACGACPDCRMFHAGSHPDFHMVYKELARYHDDEKVRKAVMQELGIGVIRQFLIAAAGLTPTRGRGKVFVVREADLMSQEAQNSLLKTLEEPPSGATIILICRRPEELLPTTRSRCALVRFGPLPRQFVRAQLAEAGLEERECAFWSAFTEGSVGRALGMAAAGLYEIKRDVLARIAANDAQLGEHLTKVSEGLSEAAVAAVAKEADGAALAKTLAVRRAAGDILELIAGAFADALTLASGADRPLVHPDQQDVTEALAGRFGLAPLAEIVEQLSRLEQLLWRNVSPKIVWDNVAITCASAAPLRV